MDKVAVQMFAAPIERTPKNIVSLAILVSLATRKRRREGKIPANTIAWLDDRSETTFHLSIDQLRAVLNGVSPLVWRRFLSRPVVVRTDVPMPQAAVILEQAGRLLATE